MAYSKVTHNGQILIDLTNDTITQNVLRPGYTAHDASGTIVEGSYVPSVTQDEDGYLVLDEDGDATDFFDMSKPQGVMVTDSTTIPAYSCYCRTGIVSVIAENATSIGNYALSHCSSLKSCYMPNVKNNTATYSFSHTALEGLVLPSWNVGMGNYLCQACTSMKYFDAPVSSISGQNVFNGCTVLDTIILRKTGAIATLSNLNAFNNTPYANGKSGGVIYVPNDLISTYESATNWSTLVGYGTLEFKAIEGSVYEEYYADGREINGGGAVVVPIPSDYQRVQYIENPINGTAYIQTNYTPVIGDILKCKIMLNNAKNYHVPISAGEGTNQFVLLLTGNNNVGYVKIFGTGAATEIRSNIPYNGGAIDLTMASTSNDNNFTIVQDGNQYVYNCNIAGELDGTNTNLRLMLRANGENTTNMYGRFYSLTVYNNETKKLNLVPCYRKSDGEIGMYDTVSNTFYTNAGLGSFKKGIDIS